MKNEIKELLRTMPRLDDGTGEQFIQLLELPDDHFDQVYPMLKGQISKIYEGEEFQKQLLAQVELFPALEINEERQVIEDFLTTIRDDDTLSDNKKELIETMFHSTLQVFERLLQCNRLSVTVQICKLSPNAIIPKYAHLTDAGADICAIEETKIEPGETKIIKTGIAVSIPVGYEIQVRPRSGLSLRSGLRIANAPGTIDSDYRGEIGVIMTNTNDIPYVIDEGMKIAQLVISPVPMIRWEEVETVEDLGITERQADGFGSTGKS